MRKTKVNLSKLLKKCKRGFKISIVAIMLTTLFGVIQVHAASPTTTFVLTTTPKLVTGTVKAFQNATTWLLLIIPVGAGFVFGYHALMKALADDQAVIAERNKKMKNVVISAAIGTTASGLVSLILSFYA